MDGVSIRTMRRLIDMGSTIFYWLKMMGTDPEIQIIIYGMSNNPAYNGAVKHA
jgi:hypothetical protein